MNNIIVFFLLVGLISSLPAQEKQKQDFDNNFPTEKIDSIIVSLFQDYNYEPSQFQTKFGNKIEGDTTITQMEPDSSIHVFHYFRFDSSIVKLYDKSFDGFRYLKSIIFRGSQQLKLFNLEPNCFYDSLNFENTETYAITNENRDPYAICIERFHIKNFDYPTELQILFVGKKLRSISLVYTNKSEFANPEQFE